jgi:hypothetical protein
VQYVTVDELVAILGPGADRARADTAASAISEWIDTRTGRSFGAGGDPFDPLAGAIPARIHQLALNGALRFYHDPEAPYGVIGGPADVPMYMRSLMTDADALLLGLRSDFGIA